MVAYLNTTVIYCEILTLEKVGIVAKYSATFISLAPDSSPINGVHSSALGF